MASVMAISFMLNGPSMGRPPRPILKAGGCPNRDLPPLQERTVQTNASHLHSTAPTTGDPFTSVNAALDGSKLVQMTHKRSPHGPDFEYENRDYPEMDGLIYRMFDPEPSPPPDAHFGAQQQSLEEANLAERGEHVIIEPDHGDYPQQQPNNIIKSQQWALGYDRMVDQESRPLPKYYQNDGQHPASNMMVVSDSSLITSKNYQNGGQNWHPTSNMITIPENRSVTNKISQNGWQYWNPVDLTAIPDNLPVLDNNNSQNIRQLWEPINLTIVPDRIPTPVEYAQSEDSTLSPVYDFLGQTASTLGVTYAEELLLSPRQLLPIIERSNTKPALISPKTPYSRPTNQTPTAPRSKKTAKQNHAQTTSASPNHLLLPKKESQQTTPPGYTIDYFTKKPRKMRMTDSRAQLRKQFNCFVEKPIEQRPQGVYWAEGDSEMEFSEWEEANRSVERMNRREKDRKERTLRVKRGEAETLD